MTRREALLAAAGVLIPVKAAEAYVDPGPLRGSNVSVYRDGVRINWLDQRVGDTIVAVCPTQERRRHTWVVTEPPTAKRTKMYEDDRWLTHKWIYKVKGKPGPDGKPFTELYIVGRGEHTRKETA